MEGDSEMADKQKGDWYSKLEVPREVNVGEDVIAAMILGERDESDRHRRMKPASGVSVQFYLNQIERGNPVKTTKDGRAVRVFKDLPAGVHTVSAQVLKNSGPDAHRSVTILIKEKEPKEKKKTREERELDKTKAMVALEREKTELKKLKKPTSAIERRIAEIEVEIKLHGAEGKLEEATRLKTPGTPAVISSGNPGEQTLTIFVPDKDGSPLSGFTGEVDFSGKKVSFTTNGSGKATVQVEKSFFTYWTLTYEVRVGAKPEQSRRGILVGPRPKRRGTPKSARTP